MPFGTEKIAGRTCRTLGPVDADHVCILFHGFTQTSKDTSWHYTDFPEHTGLDKEPAAEGWRFYFPDGGNRAWSMGDDLEYVLEVFSHVNRAHAGKPISVGGFSQGSLPTAWLIKRRGPGIHKGLICSGLYSTALINDVPIMGVVARDERVPWCPLVSFNQAYVEPSSGYLDDNGMPVPEEYDGWRPLMEGEKPYGLMQDQYRWAVNTIPGFVEAIPGGKAAGMHTWKCGRGVDPNLNPVFLEFLKSPR